MATAGTNDELCAGCFRDNEEVTADLWCNDCAEPVCRPCGKLHRRLLPPHEVIDIEDVSTISKSVPKNCILHNEEKNILFCAKHDKIICRLCLSESHKECNDITKIEKAALGIKETTSIHQLKDKIKTLTESVEGAQKANEVRLNNIDDEKGKADNHLKLLHECVDGHIRRIETELSTNYDKVKNEISDDGKHVCEIGQTLPIYLNELDAVVEKSSEIHLFHVLKHLQATQISEEGKMKQIKERVHLPLDAIPDGFVKTIDDAFKTVEGRKLNISSNTNLKESQVQKTDISSPSDIQRIVKSDTGQVFDACCFTEDNRLVVVEYRKTDRGNIKPRLKIYDDKCNVQSVSLSFHGTDVCMYDKSNALVTEKGRIRVAVVNVSSLKEGRIITPKYHEIYGSPTSCSIISCYNGIIWILIQFEVNENNTKKYFKRISSIDFNGNITRAVTLPDDVCDFCYSGKIYMSHGQKNDITVTTNGQYIVTIYSSLDLREGCKMIISGNNILLLEKESNTVYKLNIDSKTRCVVQKEGISNPSHFCFNGKTKELAVVMESGKSIKFFKIQMP